MLKQLWRGNTWVFSKCLWLIATSTVVKLLRILHSYRFKKAGTFAITDTELYIPVANLLTHDSIKLLKQLKSGFNKTINWNKYQLNVTPQTQIEYLDSLID